MASATNIPERVPGEGPVGHHGGHYGSVETEPLLGKPGDATLPENASIMRSFFIGTGVVAELGIILLALNIWAHIFMKPVILFSGHPLAMTIAIFTLVQSILALQPTSTPGQKRVGQRVHASLNLVAFVALVTGAVFIQVNKFRSGSPHFHSPHAYVGTITLLVLVAQYVVGFTMWATPGLYGGVDHAKKLYKYHRYSGYLALVLLLTAVCTAMKTDYVVGVLGIGFWGVVVAALVVFLGVFARIQKHKLGLAVRRPVVREDD
ncbi:hypothetical protein E4U43_003684 [Claviceps pusilla]|uniref:Cytochrome b561 domain-containing protein n=1 Tax=Claviceps pusilla TaxID=123648 RepID=A0A9P7N726_9HYPO|nr:hypothetical protein E4U43_003684 [Claviceps pusilla]